MICPHCHTTITSRSYLTPSFATWVHSLCPTLTSKEPS